MIPQDTIEQIRQAVDIAQVIGEYVRLKKRGKNFIGLCPFHQEKTPSFNVSPDKQIFHCFGCGKGGNVFTFLMEHEKMSFIEAVRLMARKANIPIRETTSDYKRELIERLHYAHQVAVDYYCKRLLEPRYSVVYREYLQKRRGIKPETIEEFKLGFADEAWEGLINHAAGRDIKPQELEQAGLAVFSERKGKHFDRFRQRLMIPIYNLSRQPIAFGGRTMKKGEPAKYVNSPETPLYNKSNILYNLNFAKEHIRDDKAVIVVEGYFDVISLWQVGIKNVVASSGTAFTAQQASLLARFADEVYLFFDADSAGRKAALRSVDSLFDAGLEVKVIVAPKGEDPDSVARREGLDKIQELKENALAYIPFRIQDIDIDRTGIIEREKLVKEMAALASRIGDPTRRSLFIQEAAGQLNVDQEILKTAGASDITPRVEHQSAVVRFSRMELDFLSLLFNTSGPIDYIFEEISPEDLDSRQLSRLYSAMITQYKMDGTLDAGRLIENFQDEESISLLSEIASSEWDEDLIEDELRARVNDFKIRKQKRIRDRLKNDLREAEAADDHERAQEILKEMQQHDLEC